MFSWTFLVAYSEAIQKAMEINHLLVSENSKCEMRQANIYLLYGLCCNFYLNTLIIFTTFTGLDDREIEVRSPAEANGFFL
jgi:hypothetical protein